MGTKSIITLAIGLSASGAAYAGAMVPLVETLPRGDYVVSSAVDIGFEVNFFGTEYSQLYVSNRGNINFSRPNASPSWVSSYNDFYIAPYFSDVVTSSSGSVTYGKTTFDGYSAFGVSWIDVPGYGARSSYNSFQLLIVDRSDVGAGDFDFIFNYDQIQWKDSSRETIASYYSYSYGSVFERRSHSAFVGYGAKEQDYGFSTGSSDGGLLTLTNPNQLPYQSLNSDVAGRFVFEVRDGVVSPGLPRMPLPAVPEPEAWGMMLAGLGLLSAIARRRRAGC
ncbi:MAG: PEP-CTERM sorting domain-containing protein [Azoarcus sp.]|nr:PEP-CTERM sorting domain-containing protein [Azoarcus sp.]